jgi:hypothetical protein
MQKNLGFQLRKNLLHQRNIQIPTKLKAYLAHYANEGKTVFLMQAYAGIIAFCYSG